MCYWISRGFWGHPSVKWAQKKPVWRRFSRTFFPLRTKEEDKFLQILSLSLSVRDSKRLFSHEDREQKCRRISLDRAKASKNVFILTFRGVSIFYGDDIFWGWPVKVFMPYLKKKVALSSIVCLPLTVISRMLTPPWCIKLKKKSIRVFPVAL